ncbi:gliding motility-associated lipoprotein GldD [Pedobacter westerhofensis]|uniref:Gliding motility-associated lipoprotein GldD n=1 Tax=Pedobacter westerhofensis TaxID=425512 RepID=A0A521CDZ0_9SPHI|nr:gliding motility lipoprotein GldD [Pedobacter westerhofensis]SMO57659.1 gliding motility-associated lipoprotein GldD [Pedobacter westerhofensis]
MKRNLLLCGLFVFICFASACNNESYVPKPRGYFNIKFPRKEYLNYNEGCPFSFEYPRYATMEADKERGAGNCWNNLSFPQFNARLHLTYYDISSAKEYYGLVEDARTLAFKHTVKANAIDQKLINFPERKVYGIYYAIEGNTASSVQFFLTDSAKHYFRGALYFNERPQYDSIAPVVSFIKKDIERMIDTFEWKK